jgi:hypothetical protein
MAEAHQRPASEVPGHRAVTPKIYISTPVSDWSVTNIYWVTMESLTRACAAKGWVLMQRPWFGVSDLIRRRNLDVHRALSAGATHLITFDVDQGTDPITFIKMVESGRELTAAPVPKKHDNPDREAWNFIINENPPCIEGEWMRVQMVGSGCMCITREALIKMCYDNPYFFVEGQPIPELYAKDFSTENTNELFPYQMSEDYTFCKRAARVGIRPWIWFPGQVQHLGEKVYSRRLHNDL